MAKADSRPDDECDNRAVVALFTWLAVMHRRPTFLHAIAVRIAADAVSLDALFDLPATTLADLGAIASIESLGDLHRYARTIGRRL